MLFFQYPADAFKIRRGFFKSGWLDFDGVNFHGRIMLDMNVSGGLTDNLFAGPGFFGHKDQDILFHQGRTAESESFFPAFGCNKFVFFLLPGANVRPAGMNIIFFKMPFFDANNALAANFFLSAQRFNVGTQQP